MQASCWSEFICLVPHSCRTSSLFITPFFCLILGRGVGQSRRKRALQVTGVVYTHVFVSKLQS